MADYGSIQSSKHNYKHPISFFTNFVSKGSNDNTESVLTSPSSILDTKPFPVLKHPFWSDTNNPKVENRSVWEKLETKGVSLGLVDILIDEKPDFSSSKTDNKTVLFGSQLKIQVPSFVPHTRNESPKSPGDFGIKTRSTHVGSFSPHSSSPMRKFPFSPGACISLSASEMELSEDYTCVITYGPNPKTTHIFDDCIVESCCGVVKYSESRKGSGFLSDQAKSYLSDSFLSFCYNCKKGLGQGKEIYMYRGEKAFCSSECRYKEMIMEEEELKMSKCNHVYVSS